MTKTPPRDRGGHQQPSPQREPIPEVLAETIKGGKHFTEKSSVVVTPPPQCPSNTGDKLRAPRGARQHRLVRRLLPPVPTNRILAPAGGG